MRDARDRMLVSQKVVLLQNGQGHQYWRKRVAKAVLGCLGRENPSRQCHFQHFLFGERVSSTSFPHIDIDGSIRRVIHQYGRDPLQTQSHTHVVAMMAVQNGPRDAIHEQGGDVGPPSQGRLEQFVDVGFPHDLFVGLQPLDIHQMNFGRGQFRVMLLLVLLLLVLLLDLVLRMLLLKNPVFGTAMNRFAGHDGTSKVFVVLSLILGEVQCNGGFVRTHRGSGGGRRRRRSSSSSTRGCTPTTTLKGRSRDQHGSDHHGKKHHRVNVGVVERSHLTQNKKM
mmetsp:Transcript_8517/g.17108  ORF Transcript_8517/g.17108 Transcript_8517/m.17108 type:complete len:281 (-) Transcript_8517:16-858(-)